MNTEQKQLNQHPALDRFTGCLLGGALGDILGWPVEFDSIQQIKNN